MHLPRLLNNKLWILLLLILVLIKPSLFILLNFSGALFERYFYIIYVAALACALLTSLITFKFSRSLLISISISFVMIIGCLLTPASSFVAESFAPLLLFMLIPFNLIQLLGKSYDISTIIDISIFINYFLGIVISILFALSGLGYGADGMQASYAISVPTACYLYKMILTKKSIQRTIYCVFLILGIFLTFQGGSRGALIPVLFSFTFAIIQKGLRLSRILFFIVVVAVLYLCSDLILGVFGDSRSVLALTSGSITDMSDRKEETWLPVIDAILRSPIWGWGCFSDRLFTLGQQWAHNIFLEVACDFGLIIGISFGIYIIRLLYVNCLNQANYCLTLLFIISIPQLLVSSSYLLSNYFWVFFGYSILLKDKYRHHMCTIQSKLDLLRNTY